MKYSDLKEIMAEFRLNHITRPELVAAFALWQRPVECAENKRAVVEAVIR
jgi:hypothetical protein